MKLAEDVKNLAINIFFKLKYVFFKYKSKQTIMPTTQKALFFIYFAIFLFLRLLFLLVSRKKTIDLKNVIVEKCEINFHWWVLSGF